VATLQGSAIPPAYRTEQLKLGGTGPTNELPEEPQRVHSQLCISWALLFKGVPSARRKSRSSDPPSRLAAY
jgi:hypothetical protein